MKKALFIVLLSVAATQAFAADPVAQRQKIFKQYKNTFGQMGKVVKGEAPYNKDQFAALAAQMDTLAGQPWQYFPAGSNKGKTEARPEIWSKPAEFKKEIDKFKTQTAKLKQVSASGDMAQIKPAFGAVAESCKSCHSSFRKD